jgi:hypothetical protein
MKWCNAITHQRVFGVTLQFVISLRRLIAALRRGRRSQTKKMKDWFEALDPDEQRRRREFGDKRASDRRSAGNGHGYGPLTQRRRHKTHP